jgi:hypothetical protein
MSGAFPVFPGKTEKKFEFDRKIACGSADNSSFSKYLGTRYRSAEPGIQLWQNREPKRQTGK